MVKSVLSTVEKGTDYPNKETALIKGIFNVKEFKKYLKEKYSISGAQYALTAIIEMITVHLINKSINFIKQSPEKANMFVIELNDLSNCIKSDIDMKRSFNNLHDYSPLMDYTKNICVSKKELDKLIEKNCFGIGSTQIILSKDAYNYLSYILTINCKMLSDIARVFKEYGKKQKVDFRAIKCASDILYHGELALLINQRLEGIKNIITSDKKKDEQPGTQTVEPIKELIEKPIENPIENLIEKQMESVQQQIVVDQDNDSDSSKSSVEEKKKKKKKKK